MTHSTPLNETEMEYLLQQVKEQLLELKVLSYNVPRGDSDLLPPGNRQQPDIEKSTGEDFHIFWKHFLQVARKDLCQEGGTLNQLREYIDLTKKPTMERLRNILILDFGLTGSPLQVVLIAVAVLVLHLGIKTICTDVQEKQIE